MIAFFKLVLSPNILPAPMIAVVALSKIVHNGGDSFLLLRLVLGCRSASDNLFGKSEELIHPIGHVDMSSTSIRKDNRIRHDRGSYDG